MEFNKKGFELFRKDVEIALKEVANKHNVEIKSGKINYSEFDFKMSLDVVKNQGDKNGKQVLFEQYCELYGFKKSDYKKPCSINGELHYLVGFNPNKPKNNCSVQSAKNQKIYICNDSVVKKGFEKIAR